MLPRAATSRPVLPLGMDQMDLSRVVILSGAGLSRASGIPTFRDADGLWEGHDVQEVATPEAWFRDAETVRRFYDERRTACATVHPNPGHIALARLQQEWGPERVILITQNIDGLITTAGAEHVLEMHGTLHLLRCEISTGHPRVRVYGAQDPDEKCATCGGAMRPDIVWFGEMPYAMDRIGLATARSTTFLSVGTSGVVYPAAALASRASARGAYCLEVNPEPSGGPFDRVIAQTSEDSLPGLVDAWIRGEG
jgi:NAD-dependent deacetylase